jgi:hypothetical protein
MTDEMSSEQQTAVPPAQPVPQPQGSGRAVVAIIVIVVVIIAIIAGFIITQSGSDDDDEKDNKNGENGGGKNGGNDVIKYITALGGKAQADSAANTWNTSAVLQHVRGFSGSPNKIDREEWSWVSKYKIPTEKDDTIGDGRSMVWEYEYFPETGDIFERFHVLVFGNGTIIQWEERLSDSANSDTLSDWDLDSTGAADLAKTLSLYNNITSRDSSQKYVYYELWPYYWELNCDDGVEYIRIQIDEQVKEIIYHYP